jgi:hypothetical protein
MGLTITEGFVDNIPPTSLPTREAPPTTAFVCWEYLQYLYYGQEGIYYPVEDNQLSVE